MRVAGAAHKPSRNRNREERNEHQNRRPYPGAAAVTLALAGSAQAADDEVVIGFAIAQSGWMNAYDGPPLKGAMMAIDDINAKGGILGKQVRAVVADTKTDTVRAPRRRPR